MFQILFTTGKRFVLVRVRKSGFNIIRRFFFFKQKTAYEMISPRRDSRWLFDYITDKPKIAITVYRHNKIGSNSLRFLKGERNIL